MNFKKSNKPLVKNPEREDAIEGESRSRLDELFSRKWEVFVIKKDKVTGELIGKVACCALSPV